MTHASRRVSAAPGSPVVAPKRSARGVARAEPRPTRRPLYPWLDQARLIGDPRADVLVARLLRATPGRVDAALAALASGAADAEQALPQPLRRFLADEGMPAWVDRGRLRAAQRFAQEHATALATSLFCAALPSAFTAAKGVGVLAMTGRLRSDLDRRVNETGRFVFAVLMPGGFDDGSAVRASQCVRLMHSAVRARVLASSSGRRPDVEVPINQEDLLGTLFCFSVVVLDSLEKLGVSISPRDAEDFYYLWRVVGELLGLRKEWIPRDLAAARKLAEVVRGRQRRASASGRELLSILVDGIERHLPARGLGLVAPSVVRYLMGDLEGHLLGLREAARPADVARILPLVTGAAGRVSRWVFGDSLPVLSRSLLEAVMASKLLGREPGFHRPLAAALPAACPHSASRGSEACVARRGGGVSAPRGACT